MRKDIDKVVIQEPPIQELKKKKSCLKRSCVSGCGCVIIFLVISLLILKFTSGPRIKELKEIPDQFPTAIPIYDGDNISKINFTSGQERGKSVEVIAYVPKLVFSPLLVLWEQKTGKENYSDKEKSFFENFINIMKEPVTDHRDIIKIEWTELPAEPKFVYEYYQSELERNDFKLKNKNNNNKNYQFSFSKDNIEGVLYIEDVAQKTGTDYISLTVNTPTQ